MFSLAILIGIYSYIISALGLSGILYKNYIFSTTAVYLLFCIYWYRKSLTSFFIIFFDRIKRARNNVFALIFIGIFFLQAFINFVGALGPELGFDALWYHITIPKIYLENHSIFYIPGGLLYYSLMPKLTEMLYVGALAINGEILAKLIHFSFGLLASIALYKLSRKFFTPKISLISVVVFYSNLVVAWQSTTAYVDLARTFFEIMALWGFFNFWKKREKKWLIESAVMLGLAISTKLLAIGSVLIMSILIVTYFIYHRKSVKNLFIGLFVYWVICLLIPLPWFVYSYIHSGNPVYPFFTDIYNVGFNIALLNPIKIVVDIWGMFIELSDPISPVYIIFLPLVLVLFKKLKPEIKLIAIYSFLAIIVWYITPRTGGGRFILPYLPVFSILVAAVIEKTKDKRFGLVLISVILIVSFVTIFYRGIANSRYIPAIIGLQSKSDFLENRLNFAFGDFYDIDGYFKNNIRLNEKVLLYGFHNLYYINFPFLDSSWVKKGDMFNYIATQNTDFPKRFKDWELIYQNPKTHVKLYSKGGIKWAY